MTPMEQMDEAVRRFAGESWEREGVVTGWVLMASTTRFCEDGAPAWAWDYAVGPDTDLIRAVGLVEACRLVMQRAPEEWGQRVSDTCRKIVHTTKDDAWAHARALRTKTGASVDVRPYWCDQHHAWHVGHSAASLGYRIRQATRRARA